MERQAINAPIQGTAADIIRRAMVRMDEALAEARLSARMLLQVHDELVFEVPDEEVDATLPVISRVMVGGARARRSGSRCRSRSRPGRRRTGTRRIEGRACPLDASCRERSRPVVSA